MKLRVYDRHDIGPRVLINFFFKKRGSIVTIWPNQIKIYDLRTFQLQMELENLYVDYYKIEDCETAIMAMHYDYLTRYDFVNEYGQIEVDEITQVYSSVKNDLLIFRFMYTGWKQVHQFSTFRKLDIIRQKYGDEALDSDFMTYLATQTAKPVLHIDSRERGYIELVSLIILYLPELTIHRNLFYINNYQFNQVYLSNLQMQTVCQHEYKGNFRQNIFERIVFYNKKFVLKLLGNNIFSLFSTTDFKEVRIVIPNQSIERWEALRDSVYSIYKGGLAQIPQAILRKPLFKNKRVIYRRSRANVYL